MTGASFPELLDRRRMVRSYLPDPIERETIERIVRTVRRAPSAGFSQGQLAALSEGLGAGVYGVPGERVAEVKGLLGLPEDVHFVCVVTIGEQTPDVDESVLVSRLTERRAPFDELVRWSAGSGSGHRHGSVPSRPRLRGKQRRREWDVSESWDDVEPAVDDDDLELELELELDDDDDDAADADEWDEAADDDA
jgi:hypothetical protein